MMPRVRSIPLLAILALVVLAGPGCLSYKTYRVETGGSELVLRRVDAARADAGAGELALQPADHNLLRTVGSLQGKRVRVAVPDHGAIDGEVVDAAGVTLLVRELIQGSAIDNARPGAYEINLAHIDTIDVSDSKGEGALIVAVAVGTIAGLLAMLVHGVAATAGN